MEWREGISLVLPIHTRSDGLESEKAFYRINDLSLLVAIVVQIVILWM